MTDDLDMHMYGKPDLEDLASWVCQELSGIKDELQLLRQAVERWTETWLSNWPGQR